MPTGKYTVVQHSAYGYKRDPQFQKGLESRALLNASFIRTVERAGGLIFDSYEEAERFAEKAQYPDDYRGLTPNAQGTFADQHIDGLKIYVPVRQVIG